MKIALWLAAAYLVIITSSGANRGFLIGCGLAMAFIAAIAWHRAHTSLE